MTTTDGARRVLAGALLGWALVVAPATRAADDDRTFERTFQLAGRVNLDVLTRTGGVVVRAGAAGVVHVRGTVKRNVSWRGARVTDEQIARLRSAPPVRADASTIRIERLADDAAWRSITVDYEILVPADARMRVVTESGGVSMAGTSGDVRVDTESGAIRVDAKAGSVALRSGSGGVRVSGTLDVLAIETQSGAIVAEATSVGALTASSGSDSMLVTGIRGSARAETGSGRIVLEGGPLGDWTVRSRSGSISLRVPPESKFDVVAVSRSGDVKVPFDVASAIAPTKHRVEGAVNGGGPKISVETGSSEIAFDR